jgi:hypothetical protein
VRALWGRDSLAALGSLRASTELPGRKGHVAIAISGIAGWNQQRDVQGPNPFSHLGYEVSQNMLRLKEFSSEGNWIWSPDSPGVSAAAVERSVTNGENKIFGELFRTYDWVINGGYNMLDPGRNSPRSMPVPEKASFHLESGSLEEVF